MPSSVPIQFNGHEFIALAERALLWTANDTLIISDLHLGKGDIFRAAGIAIPSGGTLKDLDRLTTLLKAHNARQLIIVGDIIHAARTKPNWLERWQTFRREQRNVAMHVILGNHDRHLDHASLQVEAHDTLVIDGITFAHDAHGDLPQINGHIHPVVKVPGIDGRWPVFAIKQNTITLPAFSLFTGGHLIDTRGDWIACIKGEVLAHLRQT